MIETIRQIQKGSASQIVLVDFIDATSVLGAGFNDPDYDESGLTCYYVRDSGVAAVAVTLADMTLGTFTSGGLKKVDDTNMPGVCQFCPPDAALLTGASEVVFYFKGPTDFVHAKLRIVLTGINIQDGTAGGISRLDAAVSSISAPSAASVADAVWDEARAGHVGAGSFGEGIASVQGNVTGSVNSVTTGVTLAAAAVQAIWDAATSALTTVGSIGKRLADNVDAVLSAIVTAIGTKASQASVNTLQASADAIETLATAIDERTANLPDDPAGVSDIPTVAQIQTGVYADRALGTTSGTPTTTSIICTGAELSTTDDVYNNSFLVPLEGALKGVPALITDYVGSTKTFTVQAMPSALAADVEVCVVGKVPTS